jgi:hypothetical protein
MGPDHVAHAIPLFDARWDACTRCATLPTTLVTQQRDNALTLCTHRRKYYFMVFDGKLSAAATRVAQQNCYQSGTYV